MSLALKVDPNSAWQKLGLDASKVNPVKSMIGEDESLYLHWLAREYYRGDGEIVDAGCLLGGSTCALASGLLANPGVTNKAQRIHSYDLFRFCDGFRGHVLPQDAPYQQGDDLLPLFRRNTIQYEPMLKVEPGDICRKKWSGQPIEIFFIDVAKSWGIHNHLMREFFPRLIPGRSIVVHQDYFHWGCWWIHLTMQYLSSYFEVVHNPWGSTLSFRLLRSIPEKILHRNWSKQFDAAVTAELMDRAIAPTVGPLRSMLLSAKAAALAERQAFGPAAQAVDEALKVEPWDEIAMYDIVRAATTLRSVELIGLHRQSRLRQDQYGDRFHRLWNGLGDIAPNSPLLVGQIEGHNLVLFDRRCYALPMSLGHIDLRDKNDRGKRGVIVAADLEEAEQRVSETVLV